MMFGTAALALLIGSAAAPQSAPLIQRSSCELPPLDRHARLVVLQTSGGDAVSTVGIAGLNEGMTTGEIRIGPGRARLQLIVFSSSNPMVLRVTGQVTRVSRVVMISRVGAGVTGVPSSTVRFAIGTKCYAPQDPAKLHQALGMTPDVSRSIDELHQAWTDGRRFRHQETEPADDRPKTHLQEEMDRFHPGGIVAIDAGKVVASGSVVEYSVLPDTAGAVQLERSGALVEATRDEIDAWTAKAKTHHGARLIDLVKPGRYGQVYPVTRPIQMPAGLCGAHLLTFLVPSKEFLSGDPCHSEILALDGHILAPSYYVADPDCGLAVFEALARPKASGPLRLRTIHCVDSSPGRGDYSVAAASPDAKHMAFFPNSDQRSPLRVRDISGTGQMRDYAFTSTLYGNLTHWYWPGSPPAYEWSEDSSGIWAARPASDGDSGRSPLTPAFIRLDGSIMTLPDVRHPPGLMDGLRWVGGRGRAIASFRNPEVTDKATHQVLPISYGMINAVNGAVLDDFQNAEFQKLRQTNRGLKEFFYADQLVAAQLADGRLQALMDLGRWVLWSEGEAPRVVPDLPPATSAIMSADGKAVLMLRPDLPSDANSEIRVFCEDDGGESDEPCFRYEPREGTWASLHDVATGRLLWRLPWRFDRHDRLGPAVMSPDSCFALFTMVARTDPNRMLVALVSMQDGRIMQTLPRPYGDFAMGFAADGKVAWIVTRKATILYDVD